MAIHPILTKILDHKKDEIRYAKRLVSEQALRDAAKSRGQARSLQEAITGGADGPRVIAEIKRATPAEMLRPAGFDPGQIARAYEAAGAAAISVLTDARFFCGSPLYVPLVREQVAIPVLRKDFIIDKYQVAESAAMGADAILLMAVLLANDDLIDLYQYAKELGMETLVEIHSESEWEKVKGLNPKIVGINNRDFLSADLAVDIHTTLNLAPKLPKNVCVISESGIKSADDIRTLARSGVQGFLIGSLFMREEDPGAALSNLFDNV